MRGKEFSEKRIYVGSDFNSRSVAAKSFDAGVFEGRRQSEARIRGLELRIKSMQETIDSDTQAGMRARDKIAELKTAYKELEEKLVQVGKLNQELVADCQHHSYLKGVAETAYNEIWELLKDSLPYVEDIQTAIQSPIGSQNPKEIFKATKLCTSIIETLAEGKIE